VTKRQIVRIYEGNGEILITNKKVEHKIALNATIAKTIKQQNS